MPGTVAERADALPALGEVFREHGFEGASLALIGERTGLGKGSLYHFFPGGKEEMAAAVTETHDTDVMLSGRVTYDSFAGAWPEREAAGTLKLRGAYFAIADGVLHVMDDDGNFAPA